MAESDFFHDVVFPEAISWGARGGPGFKTRVLMADAGNEVRVGYWSKTRASYDVGHTIKTEAQMEELLTFFYGRMGMLYAFKFTDPMDYRSSLSGTPITIGTGNGVTTTFQLIKTYSDTVNPYVRTIKKPKQGTLTVYKDAALQTETTHYTVNYSTGVITFLAAPANGVLVKANFQFYVPVRFNIDNMEAALQQFNNGEWPSIPLVEVRL